MRTTKVERATKETNIAVALNVDGTGEQEIDTGVEFLDHLLSSFSKHGRFDLKVRARGDNEHHIVEDVAIALGEAFTEALGDKKGIRRFGHAILPMDDVLILASVDVSGRSYCVNGVAFKSKRIEGMSSEMIPHFITTFSTEFKINLHTRLLDGKNEHHKAEALFKAIGVALREACSVIGRDIPSTKGVL